MSGFTGGCLCGKVRYQGSEPRGGGHCHCLDCRRSSGTGHCSHMVVPKAAFKVEGEMRFYDSPTDSGNRVSRGFCPHCGSPVYSKNSAMQDMVFVRASSLDDPEVFQPQMVVYTKRELSWNKLDAALPSFESMPPPRDMPKVDA